MAKNFPCVAACDFGSSKVGVLICEITPQGLEVAGFGQAQSQGIRKGVIVNIDSAAQSLREALLEAQNFSQREVEHLVVGVSGIHVQAVASHGMVPLRDQEVRSGDVEKVLEAASAVSLPLDREVMQVVPREFVIDGQDGVHQPVGMYGRRLEAHIQLITGSITTLQNIRRCLSKVDTKVQHFVSNPFASARAVVGQEEKEAGVCVVDIGAASTDIAVFEEGVLSWLKSISIGGMHLTNDLAVGLKTHLTEAERLKHQFGCHFSNEVQERLEIPGLSGCESRIIERQVLATILQPRLEEILALVRNELAKNGSDEALPTGVVLTGGGSQLKGILDIAQRVFHLPVRLGRPSRLGGLSDMISSPAYSTLVGLAQVGFEENEDLKYYAQLYQKRGLKRLQTQFVRWVRDFF